MIVLSLKQNLGFQCHYLMFFKFIIRYSLIILVKIVNIKCTKFYKQNLEGWPIICSLILYHIICIFLEKFEV